MTHAFRNFFTSFILSRFWGRFGLGLLCGLLLTAPPLAWSEADETPPNGYAEGVQAYREGNYQAAQKTFDRLHAQYPENSRVTYYLAISEAQLGRFQQARQLYQEILSLDSQSDSAKLAKEGLEYLPSEQTTLDQPPRFQEKSGKPPAASDKNSETADSKNLPGAGTVNPSNIPGAGTLYGGMSPQDMMMLQMMMSQGGGGMNPMMYMMTQPGGSGDPNNANGMGNMDPSVMSNLLMNQMLQNFSLDSGKDQER